MLSIERRLVDGTLRHHLDGSRGVESLRGRAFGRDGGDARGHRFILCDFGFDLGLYDGFGRLNFSGH